MPLYIASGSLEPLRFDGEGLWHAGHYTPTYWAIAVLEHAFQGYRVTPESVSHDALVTALWAVGAVLLAIVVMNGVRVFGGRTIANPLRLLGARGAVSR